MTTMAETALAFFEACETGKGWDGCKAYCMPNASFSAQAEPVAELTTLAAYADWMRDLFGPLPDARYEMQAFAVDEARKTALGFAVFCGTNTGQGGPPPTGRSARADYVYAMRFEGGKIAHLTKIWNAGWSMKELGWA